MRFIILGKICMFIEKYFESGDQFDKVQDKTYSEEIQCTS